MTTHGFSPFLFFAGGVCIVLKVVEIHVLELPALSIAGRCTMARSLQYVTLDVFTTTRFKGNPLAVIFLPRDEPLPQERKQLIAREFKYSESIFVHAVDSRRPECRKIDIFTTTQELPFAGHPTIGAASWFLLLSSIEQSGRPSAITTKAGNIPISVSEKDPRKVSAHIPHNARIHSARLPLAELLRLHPPLEPYLHATTFSDGFPLVSIVKRMTAMHVRLPSLEALNAVTAAAGGYVIPPADASAGGYVDPGWGGNGHVAVYFHVRNVWDDELRENVIRSRMVVGNEEDPATGSAASGLAAYLALTEPETNTENEGSCCIVQGVEMGQRSEIRLRVALDEDGKEIKDVELQGSAVKVCDGNIIVED